MGAPLSIIGRCKITDDGVRVMSFRIIEVDFRGSYRVASFAFGDDDNKPYTITTYLTEGLNLEEAIAEAAESAAADLRVWAQEAEDFAAAARAGSLRKPPTMP